MRWPVLLFFAAFAVNCSSEPPLSTATSLTCPNPGALLPFHLESTGFQDPDNADLVANNPRFKDEASDTFGNPGGTSANVYLADSASPAAGLGSFHGRKARTIMNSGLTAQPLAGEYVSLWYYDSTKAAWTTLGRTLTDDSGYYDIAATMQPPVDAPVYAMLEADGTCQKHYAAMLPPGSQVVVSDIDGTMTASEGAFLPQLGDGTLQVPMMTDANVMMQTWDSKKYTVIYLTARPHLYFSETRSWLDSLSFPAGAVITSNTLLTSDPALVAYKSLWLARMVNTFGWKVVAAYGNQPTDVQAYQSVGIPLSRIFTVGPNAGTGGSTAIDNNDYTSHVANFVDAQPDNTP